VSNLLNLQSSFPAGYGPGRRIVDATAENVVRTRRNSQIRRTGFAHRLEEKKMVNNSE
jgi:hypothetical protein